ncbi:MAG: cysteine desulfurase [Clostridiales bacterium]|nr:cysteine desulfurase [Clostridiales bacterium]MCD7828252.1 cysteine desulfurase [Clostridiales bacterium]
MKRLIYADNAATTQLDRDAFEAMQPFLLNEYGNASQPYAFARTAKKALREARETIAECIGAVPEEIFFTSGGTESDNWAIKGSAFFDTEKRETITSQIEHHAVLHACEDIERMGYPVTYLPADSCGTVHAEELSERITSNTRLVSIMTANNEIGTIQDISSLARVSHNAGAVFHTDAVQALGHIKIDANSLGVDMLSASAHKFNGPKGIGFLYIKKGTPIRSFISGGSQEHGMRAGTENVASVVGMAAALQKNTLMQAETSSYMYSLEERLLGILHSGNLNFIRNGDEKHLPGNISLSFYGRDGEAILHRLDLMGICVSTGSACDSQNTRISHVLHAIGLDEKYAKGTIRISLSRANTTEDVDIIADSLLKILR